MFNESSRASYTSFQQEFEVVDLILCSDLPTSSVDAFTRSVIKMERQLRKLFTYLVFQSDAFSARDVVALRETLGRSTKAYFEGFEKGVNALAPATVEAMIGTEYANVRAGVDDTIAVRNKVFHGRLTNRCLQRDDLRELVEVMREWCTALGVGAERSVGFDGFARPSLVKGREELSKQYKLQLNSIDEYSKFLRQYVERGSR